MVRVDGSYQRPDQYDCPQTNDSANTSTSQISGSITHNITPTVQVDGSYEGLDLHDGRPLTEREEHRTQLLARDVAVPVLVEQHERLTQLCKS